MTQTDKEPITAEIKRLTDIKSGFYICPGDCQEKLSEKDKEIDRLNANWKKLTDYLGDYPENKAEHIILDLEGNRNLQIAFREAAEAQLLQQSEEIRRLREALEKIKNNSYSNPASISYATQALTPTPSTWGTKALEVVEAAEKLYQLRETRKLRLIPLTQSELNEILQKADALEKALSELQKERTN